MLQFHTGGVAAPRRLGRLRRDRSGASRARPSRRTWARCRTPASGCGWRCRPSKVGLKPGEQITGFALTQFGGTVYWDKVGITGRTDPAADPAQSLLAWWKPRGGKDTPDVPPEIGKLLKAGPEKVKKPEDLKRLRDYYLAERLRRHASAAGRPGGRSGRGRGRAARRARRSRSPARSSSRDLPTPRDSFVMVRGQYDKPGEKVEPGTPAVPAAAEEGRPGRPRHPARPGQLARVARAPADRPRRGQPLLAAVLRHRPGQDERRLRHRRASRRATPNCSTGWPSDFRDGGWDVKALVRLMRHLGRVPPVVAVTPELLRPRPGEPPATPAARGSASTPSRSATTPCSSAA